MHEYLHGARGSGHIICTDAHVGGGKVGKRAGMYVCIRTSYMHRIVHPARFLETSTRFVHGSHTRQERSPDWLKPPSAPRIRKRPLLTDSTVLLVYMNGRRWKHSFRRRLHLVACLALLCFCTFTLARSLPRQARRGSLPSPNERYFYPPSQSDLQARQPLALPCLPSIASPPPPLISTVVGQTTHARHRIPWGKITILAPSRMVAASIAPSTLVLGLSL